MRVKSKILNIMRSRYFYINQTSCFIFFLTAIGNAYAVLSNANKRKQYDQCGEESRHPSGHGPDNENFEPDISPEDLFNMFFGGGYPTSMYNRCL